MTDADRYDGAWSDSSYTSWTRGSQLSPNGNYEYGYDEIGNRVDTTVDTTTEYFCANAVNAYTFTDDAADTCPTPGSPTGSFSWEDDGMLSDDGVFDYYWGAENRLISVITPIEAGQSEYVYENGDQYLSFTYDYMGRRVQKIHGVFQSGDWVTQSDERFVYDGWNVIMVLDGLDSNTTLRTYTWGLDLSGSLQGAGGVGGLLGSHDVANSKYYWFLHDANGNVSEILRDHGPLVQPRNVTLAGHYEYDPYGKMLAADDVDSSGIVDDNPFRFSTKWLDTELASSGQGGAIGSDGLYYYGYRYYSPTLGRWISWDLYGEAGGLNLYACVANRPVDLYDYLGLVSVYACYQNALLNNAAMCFRKKIKAFGCKHVPLHCDCVCTRKCGGYYSPSKREVHVCLNNLSSIRAVQQATEHEYRHAFQHCQNSGFAKDCSHVACAEVSAHFCSKQCDPPNGQWLLPGETKNACVIRNSAISAKNACGGIQSATTMVTAKMAVPDCVYCNCP